MPKGVLLVMIDLSPLAIGDWGHSCDVISGDAFIGPHPRNSLDLPDEYCYWRDLSKFS